MNPEEQKRFHFILWALGLPAHLAGNILASLYASGLALNGSHLLLYGETIDCRGLDIAEKVLEVVDKGNYDLTTLGKIIGKIALSNLFVGLTSSSVFDPLVFYQAMHRLSKILQGEADMSILDLSDLKICDYDIPRLHRLAEMLKTDTNVIEIRLKAHQLGIHGTSIFTDLLRHNHNIQRLVNLSLHLVQATAIALKENRGLIEVDIRPYNNEVDLNALKFLFECLESNYTLQRLRINLPKGCDSWLGKHKLHLRTLQTWGELPPLELLRNSPSIIDLGRKLGTDFVDRIRYRDYIQQLAQNRALRDSQDELIRQALVLRNGTFPIELVGHILSFNTSMPASKVHACVNFIGQEYEDMKARLTSAYGPYPLVAVNQTQCRFFKPLATAQQVACFEQAIKTGNVNWLARQVRRGYHTGALAQHPSDHWLELAGQHQKLCVIEYLLDQGFGYAADGENLVHFAARHGYVQALASYWTLADMMAQDEYGNTPLHLALMHHQLACANYLLAQGAAMDCANHLDETPAKLAAEQSLVLTEAKQLVPVQLSVSKLNLNPSYF